MKSTIAFLSTALIALSAQAYKDGTYTCVSSGAGNTGTTTITYKVNTVTVSGLEMAHLEVTTDTPEKEYNVKGIATVFSDNSGKETLRLGALTVELTKGRPGCAQ